MSENPLKPLDDEQTVGVAGGYIFCSDEINVFPATKPWEVIDNQGEVVARFADNREANDYAKQHGYSTTWLRWHELKKLRETGSPW